MTDWERYLAYLTQWAAEHSDTKFAGMSPACYDEWLCNEGAQTATRIVDEVEEIAMMLYDDDIDEKELYDRLFALRSKYL